MASASVSEIAAPPPVYRTVRLMNGTYASSSPAPASTSVSSSDPTPSSSSASASGAEETSSILVSVRDEATLIESERYKDLASKMEALQIEHEDLLLLLVCANITPYFLHDVCVPYLPCLILFLSCAMCMSCSIVPHV
jgi:hypothetical protein